MPIPQPADLAWPDQAARARLRRQQLRELARNVESIAEQDRSLCRRLR
jgi:hypothetical protein